MISHTDSLVRWAPTGVSSNVLNTWSKEQRTVRHWMNPSHSNARLDLKIMICVSGASVGMGKKNRIIKTLGMMKCTEN
jgi:hypothetical protein